MVAVLTTRKSVAHFLQLGDKEAVQVVGVGVVSPGQLHGRGKPMVLEAANKKHPDSVDLKTGKKQDQRNRMRPKT